MHAGNSEGRATGFQLGGRDVLCRKATVKLRPGWRGRKDQPRRGGGGAGSSPGRVGEVQGAAQVGWGGPGSIPAPVIGLPSLPGPSKQVRAIGAGGVHLEFAEGRRSSQNRAEKRGRTAPWRGLEAVSPLDPTPWAAESTAGGLSVRAPCCVGDRWQRRGRGTGGWSGVYRSGPGGREALGCGVGAVRCGKGPGRAGRLQPMGPADAHVQGQGKGAEDCPGPHVLAGSPGATGCRVVTFP